MLKPGKFEFHAPKWISWDPFGSQLKQFTTWRLAEQSCRPAGQVVFTAHFQCQMLYCSYHVVLPVDAYLAPFPFTVLPRSIWVPTTAAAVKT